MTLTASHRPLPARRRTRAALALALSALLAGSGLALMPAAAHAATTGTIESPEIVVTSDGDRTTSPVLDDSLTNGIVGTNDTVCFTWRFASAGVTDGTLSQTLPAGWSWTTASLATLVSSSSLYTSSYVITGTPATGQTLTATISVPEGSTIVSLGPLCAVPSSSAAVGPYTPTLTVTDEVGPVVVTAPDVEVVGEPKTDLVKYLYRSQTYALHDFGSGAENAMYIDYRIVIRQPTGAPNYGSLPAVFPSPFTIEDSYSVSPAVATTQIQLLEVTSGTATLSGSDIVVTGATGVGTNPWGVTVRMWFRASELPTATSTPAYVTVTNTATVDGPVADEDPSNNTATGTVQSPGFGGTGTGTSGKQLWAAKNPDAPTYSIDPSTGSSNVNVTNGIVSPGAVVFSRFYAGVRAAGTGATAPMTNPIAYDFWDPSTQRLHGDESNIFVGNASGPALPASQYEILYTTQVGTGTVNPATLTWFPRSDPGFDISTVRGIRIRYVGDGTPNPVYTAAWLLASVPFDIIAAPGTTVPDTAKFTVDEATIPAWTRTVQTSTNTLSLTKAVNHAGVTSGSTLQYTLKPVLATPPGARHPSAVTGVRVTDTLPTSIVSVNTSAVSPDWSVAQTPGNPGPDGIPGTSDDVSGIQLVFTWLPNGGEVQTGSSLTPIVFSATTSLLRPASGTVINTAIVSADQNYQSASSRTATAVTTISQADVLAKTKVVDVPVIEVRDPQVSWTSSWFNFQGDDQGLSSFVDVLPYNGDARGTSFTGTAELATATLLGAGASGYSLEYTTDDPATVGAAPASATTWLAAPAGGDFTGVTGVTALRVTVPVFENGEAGVGGLRVIMDVEGQLAGDVYANTITGRINVDPDDASAGIAFPSGAPAVVTVVSSDVSGTVWRDLDGDGLLTAGEPGIAGVSLSLVNADGSPVYELDGVTPVTTTTDAAGDYAFVGFHSGDYRVIATPPAGAVNTYDHDGTLDSDSGVLALAADSELTDIDFGYRYFGSLVVAKSIVGPGGIDFGTGPFVFQVECAYGDTSVLSTSVTLTPALGADTVSSDPFSGLPEGTSCTVTETDNGGADATPAPVTVTIAVDEAQTSTVALLANAFSLGTLQVAKVLEGTAADTEAVESLEFTVAVTCQIDLGDGAFGTVFAGDVVVRGGETVPVLDAAGDPVPLPLGAHCFGEETDTAGASASVVDFDSFDNAVVVGVGSEIQRLTITATNTFDLAEVTVEKIVGGEGSAGPFSFELSCTYEGGAVALDPADAAFELSHGQSRTIEVVAGAECTAVEVDVPDSVVMTVLDTDGSTAGGTTDGVVVATPSGQKVTVTNTYIPVLAEPVDVTIEKVVRGEGPAGPFSFEFSCLVDDEPYTLADADAAFELSDGESRTVKVPIGAVCTAVEIDVASGVLMSILDTDPSTDGGATDGVVVATPDGQTITVTNQYPIVSPEGPEDDGRGGLAFTGSELPIVGVVIAGALVLGLGAVLLVIARRRARRQS